MGSPASTGQRAEKTNPCPYAKSPQQLWPLASLAVYGHALLNDATIGKFIKAGIDQQTIVAMINLKGSCQ
jgi:hypothetical protein